MMNRPMIDGGGSSGEVVQMSPDAVALVKRRFEDLSAEFVNVKEPLKAKYTSMLTGAGQFGTELDDGAAPFLISWTNVFRICGEDSGLIAGNTNKLHLDLNALDSSASTTIQL